MLGSVLGDGHDLDVYALNRLAPRTTPGDVPSVAELTLGARIKGAAAGVDWRAEGGAQLGRHPETPNVDTFAYSADGEVGYTLGGERTFRLALNGFIASGDDPDTDDRNEAYNHLFPTAHKWMGFMDFVGARSNVAGGAVLLSSQVAPRWKVYANVYEFHRLQDGANATAGRLGTELNTGFRFAIGQGVGFRVGYGLFAPVEEVSNDLFHFAEFELKAELP